MWRHERARGVGNIKKTETLVIVSQDFAITLPPVKHQVHPGGTNGDVIGPVVLSPAETLWQGTRGGGGARRSSGRSSSSRRAASWRRTRPSSHKKPRTDDTVEPVFFHIMPVIFY